MTTYTLYDPITGQIFSHLSAQTEEMARLNAGGLSMIDEVIPQTKYYSNGEFVDIPAKPTTEGQQFTFDYATKQWQVISDYRDSYYRSMRNDLLKDIDRVNPIWYASLTQEQQQELQTYRQALLDITAQAGWPTTVEWPVKPAWL